MLEWGVLIVYCFGSFWTSASAYAFASIAKNAAVHFGVSFNAINQLSIVGLVLPFVTYVPAMWLADTHRFELPFYLSMGLIVATRWIRAVHATDNVQGFYVLLATQAASAVLQPFLQCLAPALSKNYFPKQTQSLATCLGTVSSLLGIGAGMVISPIFEEDIPALLNLHAVMMSIPLILSVFCLDLFYCLDSGAISRTTSFNRLMRKFFTVSVLTDWYKHQPHEPRHTLALPFINNALVTAAGLLCGVVNAWVALVNEVAPPSVDTAFGTQMICGLFFGLGTVGSIIMGGIMDRTRHYAFLGLCASVVSTIPFAIAMIGWYFDSAIAIYVGLGLSGFFGFGLFPLVIEFGIELSFSPNFPNLEAAVSGIVTCTTNVFGALIMILTTPGNIKGLDKKDIPIVWFVLSLVGSLLFCTVPPRYNRLQHQLQEEWEVDPPLTRSQQNLIVDPL